MKALLSPYLELMGRGWGPQTNKPMNQEPSTKHEMPTEIEIYLRPEMCDKLDVAYLQRVPVEMVINHGHLMALYQNSTYREFPYIIKKSKNYRMVAIPKRHGWWTLSTIE